MKPVDAHCHLDFDQYEDDREEVIERSKQELEFVVNAGASVENNQETLEIHQDYPEFVVPALGLHPTYTDEFSRIDQVKKQVREEDPAAVGEIGLDYHHVTDPDQRKEQEKVFKQMLELAQELEKPVVVHTRDAEDRSVEILSGHRGKTMLHAFNGKPELAREAVDNGMKIGVTTQVLYSNRVQELVRELELEHLMLETDSPFLYQGDRNEPVNVKDSAEKIAELKEVGVETVVEATTRNAREFFGKDSKDS
ncbi:MAG: TatD family hydrolase [Candidatus Nanohaloarchaea archaeon]